MTVINRQKDALASNITPEELGKAMSKLDLSSIPPEKRGAAVMDHLMRIMIGSIHDPDAKYVLAAAQLLHRKRDQRLLTPKKGLIR